jgi:NAD/NADP transhydrogenase beta subunit
VSELLGGSSAHTLIQAAYFAAALLFIVGLKQMSSPVTARRGILWAGLGMLVATLVTFRGRTRDRPIFPGSSARSRSAAARRG